MARPIGPLASAAGHDRMASATDVEGPLGGHPASAQAAPAYIECPCCGKLWTAALAPNFQRATANIEQAAVRAALEGLRAEVAAMSYTHYRKNSDVVAALGEVLTAIKRRLAALP